jgi:AhpD family alkylhydroperoxidase
MTPRINAADYIKTGLGRAMLGLQREVETSGLEHTTLELMKIRVSQINGCAYCLDMHTKDARALGETEQRIYALNAWRETGFYTPRERAALEWAESLTRISVDQVPDAVYESVKPHFTEAEIVALTFAVVAINGWNRLAISLRAPVGTYQSPHAVAHAV